MRRVNLLHDPLRHANGVRNEELLGLGCAEIEAGLLAHFQPRARKRGASLFPLAFMPVELLLEVRQSVGGPRQGTPWDLLNSGRASQGVQF